jgi:hypothetical protein
MLERYKVPANALRIQSNRGEAVLWAVAPEIVMQVAIGHGDAALAEPFVKALERLFAGRRNVTCFFDGLEFTGYDSAFRATLSTFAQGQVESGQLKKLHLLTRSKLVAMGAAVVNLVVQSKIDVCANVTVFDRKLIDLGGRAALSADPPAARPSS